jgi:pyruvate,water dikinase
MTAPVVGITRAVRSLEARPGAPQDGEAAIGGDGAVAVLQSHPVKGLPTVPAEPTVILWDNANIVESFPELTLPLTFSVATELYASVYRGTCRTLGVPAATIEREAGIFGAMLGLLQGRVYYNLNSWYRVLSLLPGFRLTAGFLEAMMGARRPGAGPDERAVLTVAGAARRIELARMTVRLAWRWFRFEADARRFRKWMAALMASHRPPSPS